LLLVNFDPVTNRTQSNVFQARYAIRAGTQRCGPYIPYPYAGFEELDNSGGSVELYRPDTPQPPAHPDVRAVPAILVDRHSYAASTVQYLTTIITSSNRFFRLVTPSRL